MNHTRKSIAYHKIRPTSQPPLRPGAIQCVRTCNNCIPMSSMGLSNEDENIVSLKSYDNLLARKFILLSQYSSIQYHPGQIDILKNHFLRTKTPLSVYIIAVNRFCDTNYLAMILDHVGLPKPQFLGENTLREDIIKFLETRQSIALVIQLRTCPRDNNSMKILQKFFSEDETRQCINVTTMKDHISKFIDKAQRESTFDINLIPVSITKDHEKTIALGQGSICVQILEAFSLQQYLNGLATSQKTIHLMQHTYFDVAKNAVILPCHIVASLVLYLDHDGVTADELAEYMDWIRATSIETGVQIGFSGESICAISNALSILGNHVQLCRLDNCYRPRDPMALMDYSDILLTPFAFYNLIALSIIISHNRSNATNCQIVNFESGVRIRVEKEMVIKICVRLAIEAEANFPCRRPCTTPERNVETTLDGMSEFGKYFKIQAPALGKSRPNYWAGESDEEDQTFLRENPDNPALKVWLLVSDRDYRRQRLNYFLNAAKCMIAADALASLIDEFY